MRKCLQITNIYIKYTMYIKTIWSVYTLYVLDIYNNMRTLTERHRCRFEINDSIKLVYQGHPNLLHHVHAVLEFMTDNALGQCVPRNPATTRNQKTDSVYCMFSIEL